MKYSYKFYQGCKNASRFDEVIIKFFNYDEYLIRFAEELPENQKLVLNIVDLPAEEVNESLELFSSLLNEVSVIIDLDTQQDYIDYIEALGLKFMFAQGASTIEELCLFIACGVSEVLIQNELCFDIVKVSRICEDNNVEIRMVANVSQCGNGEITSFFIRPEDIPIYDVYIDTIEFFGPLDRQSVLLDIYSSWGWHGPLSDLIIELSEDVDAKSDQIPPYFGMSRLRCKRQCDKCNLCNDAIEMSEEIKKNNKRIVLN